MKKSSALTLLQDYGSDTDDDEVPGPRVSTKRTHKDDDEKSVKRRLPIPSSILNVNKTEIDHMDDPNLHNGRIRAFPHERGIWATYVYIPFEPHKGIREIVDFMKNTLTGNIKILDFDDYHISLTKTVILRHHWIDSFVESVKNSVRSVQRFNIILNNLQVYCNEDNTRTFIGISLASNTPNLIELVKFLDKCCEEFRLPTFYEQPNFHVSIAWCLGDKREELNKYLEVFNNVFYKIIQNNPQEEWLVLVPLLMAKIGNKHFQFPLN